MRTFQVTLKILAIAIFAIAAIHVVFGVSSELFLGAAISDSSLNDANLDSQNRFYGAIFALVGAMLWLTSQDPKKYEHVFLVTLMVFTVGGLTRLLSVAIVGWPTPIVVFLSVVEILGPPLMYLWWRRLGE